MMCVWESEGLDCMHVCKQPPGRENVQRDAEF